MHNTAIYYHHPHEINQAQIDKVIIWLHGIGATGESFIPFAKQLNLPFAVKFIFPNAPLRPVTVNRGNIGTSWFDILQKSQNHRLINKEELVASAERILSMIDHEIGQGILPNHIIVAGFSQGGAVAYHASLSYPQVGGLIAVSTYFATEEYFSQKYQNDLPILICHGYRDESVFSDFADIAKDKLHKLGLTADVRFYDTAHYICPQEIEEMRAWIERVFANEG